MAAMSATSSEVRWYIVTRYCQNSNSDPSVIQMVYLLISTSLPVEAVARWNASLRSDGEYFSRYCRKLLVRCSISGILTTCD